MYRAGALAREAVVSAFAAASLAALLAWYGPPGSDFAAHAYQRAVFLQHGFSLWNNFWYAGRYSFVTYSLLYYPLAGWFGIRLLAVATIATAALAFAVVLGREWGPTARWSSRTFAGVWAGIVLSAAFPFALGIHAPVLAALLIVPVLDLAGTMPLTPGNIGVTSGAVTMALQAHGVALTEALGAGIALHAVETAAGLVFGLTGALLLAQFPTPESRRIAIASAGGLAAAALAAGIGATLLLPLV